MSKTISNTGATGAIQWNFDPGIEATPSGLTPEGLMFYCSSRMESLDKSIQKYFAEQQARNKAMGDLSKLMEILQSGTWANGQYGSEAIKAKDTDIHCGIHADKANEILALWRSTPSQEVKDACAAAFKSVSGLDIGQFAGRDVTSNDIAGVVNGTPNALQPMTAEQRRAQVDAIKEKQSAMSKSAEMSMIQLQSLVSQRQLAVQLTTQLMQTMHETSKQVLGNIR